MSENIENKNNIECKGNEDDMFENNAFKKRKFLNSKEGYTERYRKVVKKRSHTRYKKRKRTVKETPEELQELIKDASHFITHGVYCI